VNLLASALAGHYTAAGGSRREYALLSPFVGLDQQTYQFEPHDFLTLPAGNARMLAEAGFVELVSLGSGMGPSAEDMRKTPLNQITIQSMVIHATPQIRQNVRQNVLPNDPDY